MGSYEDTQRQEIQRWKDKDPHFVHQAMRLGFKPVEHVVMKFVPNAAIEAVLAGSNWLWRRLATPTPILRPTGVSSLSELKSLDLRQLDALAATTQKWAIALATSEGAIAGIGGLPGLVADIPFTVTLALRTIHMIGLCYGFDCRSATEHELVMAILAAASANSRDERAAALATLRALEDEPGKLKTSRIDLTAKGLSQRVGMNLARRKMLQAIPAAGAVVGAGVNAVYIHDVGWAARRVFQELWLNERSA